MASENKGPSWSEQWGGGDHQTSTRAPPSSGTSNGDKMAKAKAAASEGLTKAKSAAILGAQKVKVGAKYGYKWAKAQYEKRTSK